MRPYLLQQHQQHQAMSHKGRFARALYSAAARQLAVARGVAHQCGSRAAPSAVPAAAVGRPCLGAGTSALPYTFRSRSSKHTFSSSSSICAGRPHPRRLGAYYSSDAPAAPQPDAGSSTGVPVAPSPEQLPAAAYDSDAATAMLAAPAAVQQPPEQAPIAPMQPRAATVGQMQQPAAQLQPVPQQVLPEQPTQMPGMQQPLPQQQLGAPVQYPVQHAVQPPMQMPAGHQQGVPMQAIPGQQPAYVPAAPGQQVYMQPAAAAGQMPAFAPQMPAGGQVDVQQGYMQQPGTSALAPAGQQMSAYSAQTPMAGQTPAGAVLAAAAAPAAAAAAAAETSDFAEEWVNCVGLTGVVLRGPFLQQFSTGKAKASIVLGLLARATGDSTADNPRPILVEAWNDRARALAQQVQTGAVIFLQGHLALDLRPPERSPSHGPALTVEADTWELVTRSTLPEGRAICTYKGEFDGVLRMVGGGAGSAAAGSASYAQNTYGGQSQQQQGYQQPVINKEQAMQMFLQGTNIFNIAKSLDCRPGDVFPALVEAAEAQGGGSPAWEGLLAFVNLKPRNKAIAYFNAALWAVSVNKEPLTKAGHVRLKAVRDLLLSPACALAPELKQQEAGKGGVNRTYDQVKVLLAMIRADARL